MLCTLKVLGTLKQILSIRNKKNAPKPPPTPTPAEAVVLFVAVGPRVNSVAVRCAPAGLAGRRCRCPRPSVGLRELFKPNVNVAFCDLHVLQFEVVQFILFLGLIIRCYSNMKNVCVVLK